MNSKSGVALFWVHYLNAVFFPYQGKGLSHWIHFEEGGIDDIWHLDLAFKWSA